MCNGLSIIVSDETSSELASKRAVTRWLSAIAGIRRKSRDDDLGRDDLGKVESL